MQQGAGSSGVTAGILAGCLRRLCALPPSSLAAVVTSRLTALDNCAHSPQVLMIQGFLAVRKHADRILLLVEMMQSECCSVRQRRGRKGEECRV